MAANGTGSLRWSPLSSRLGAEVSLDLSAPLSGQIQAELLDLFYQRQLLVFRNQNISLDDQIAVMSCLSPLVDDPPVEYVPGTGTKAAGRFMTNVVGEEDALGGDLPFHSEFAYLDPPIYGLSLWADAVPDDRGPATLFSSCFDTYESLPADLKRRVGGLEVVHIRHANASRPPDRRSPVPPDTLMSVAPLVYTHPLTGQATLYFSPLWTHSVVGMDLDDSAALLTELENALFTVGSRYRHAWNLHDLVIWDNIKLLHAREPVELGGRPRRLRRVIIGDPARYVGWKPLVSA